jgi:hypothetical protein
MLLGLAPFPLARLPRQTLLRQLLGRDHQADDETIQTLVDALMLSVRPRTPNAEIRMVDSERELTGRHEFPLRNPRRRRLRQRMSILFSALHCARNTVAATHSIASPKNCRPAFRRRDVKPAIEF